MLLALYAEERTSCMGIYVYECCSAARYRVVILCEVCSDKLCLLCDCNVWMERLDHIPLIDDYFIAYRITV